MRAVVQRVSKASVRVDGNIVGEIDEGLLVFIGIGKGDNYDDLEYVVEKVLSLRIFEDDKGKMNLSVENINGEILVISQFTLYGDVRKGRRPSFSESANPEVAKDLYEQFIKSCKKSHIKVESGIFGADMNIELVNNGPVTVLIDSKKIF